MNERRPLFATKAEYDRWAANPENLVRGWEGGIFANLFPWFLIGIAAGIPATYIGQPFEQNPKVSLLAFAITWACLAALAFSFPIRRRARLRKLIREVSRLEYGPNQQLGTLMKEFRKASSIRFPDAELVRSTADLGKQLTEAWSQAVAMYPKQCEVHPVPADSAMIREKIQEILADSRAVVSAHQLAEEEARVELGITR